MTVRSFRLAATAVLSFAAGSLVTSQLTRAQSVRVAGDRVFELRVYHSFPGRLPRLQSNFRDHNLSFLKKHGMTSIGYWTPQDAPASENTLIFILAHDSREAATRHWKEFREDPEWQKVAKASEADGKIVEKVESTFMTPTDYSALR
jgi:NIPSNAP protein